MVVFPVPPGEPITEGSKYKAFNVWPPALLSAGQFASKNASSFPAQWDPKLGIHVT